jgi:hypothetical protein
MLEGFREIRQRLDRALHGAEGSATIATPVRAAVAHLFLATGAVAGLERMQRSAKPEHLVGHHSVPRPLTWAPLVIGPLAAAAQLEHARNPGNQTATAVRLLNGASIVIGGSLLLHDLWRRAEHSGTPYLGAAAFASAGLLGFALEAHVREMQRSERDLRRRARLVERLVPRRRGKVDRIVVHV